MKRLTNFFHLIINIGTHHVEEDHLKGLIRMMNYWLLISCLLCLPFMIIGLFENFLSFFLPSSTTLVAMLITFYLISKGNYRTGWHLVLSLPILLVTILPLFTKILPTVLILFFVCQTIVFVFFSERRILFSFLVFYSISAVICAYLLFGDYKEGINYDTNIFFNILLLIMGLGLQFYAMFLLQKRREEKELAIIESENKFKSIFNYNPLSILITDAGNFKNKHGNARHKELFGYSSEELRHLKISQFTHPEDQDNHNPDFENVLAGKAKYAQFQKRYIKKSGEIFWALTSVSIIRDQSGKPKYYIGMTQDITKQKQQDAQIQQLLEELKQLNADLEQKVQQRTINLQKTNEKLRQSNEDLEQFAYIASHDLQEPLRMVGNFVQLLKRRYHHQIDEAGQEYIQFAVEGVTRMSELMKGLLEYSRVGQSEIGFKKVSLNQILTEKLLDIKQLIQEKNAEIIIADFPHNIICEPMQIGIVFYNLVVNALKFNDKSHPAIEIDHTENDEFHTFSVKDNGIGIQADYQTKIFEIFKRLNNRQEYSGNGIGLALCKKIILRHGGKIWFTSELDKGTTFYFTISKNLIE